MAMGRPSIYSDELAEKICGRIADGDSLRFICSDESMPSRETVRSWLQKNPDFLGRYARAREAQADGFADELIEIADDGTNDWMETRNGPKPDNEAIQRSKLRIETRLRLMAIMRPKVYGSKPDDGPNPTITIKGGLPDDA